MLDPCSTSSNISEDAAEKPAVARRGYTAMLGEKKLLTVDDFRVQVLFGKYIFLAFFDGFSPGLT